jgi:hypothetical protein
MGKRIRHAKPKQRTTEPLPVNQLWFNRRLRCLGYQSLEDDALRPKSAAELMLYALPILPCPYRYDTMIDMITVSRQAIVDEDQVVAELYELGITYLSNRPVAQLKSRCSPEHLLADTICQPSSRVRTAVIALFLLHPGYAAFVPTALGLLSENQRQLLKLFYTAAVHLQRLYQSDLISIISSEWVWLPNLFGKDLEISSTLSPQDAIQQLGIRHQEITHSLSNWSGTYKNAVHHLIRYKQHEAQWNQLPHKPSPHF